jgi:hypothetical protein
MNKINHTASPADWNDLAKRIERRAELSDDEIKLVASVVRGEVRPKKKRGAPRKKWNDAKYDRLIDLIVLTEVMKRPKRISASATIARLSKTRFKDQGDLRRRYNRLAKKLIAEGSVKKETDGRLLPTSTNWHSAVEKAAEAIAENDFLGLFDNLRNLRPLASGEERFSHVVTLVAWLRLVREMNTEESGEVLSEEKLKEIDSLITEIDSLIEDAQDRPRKI